MPTALAHAARTTRSKHHEPECCGIGVCGCGKARQRTARDLHQEAADTPACHLGPIGWMVGEDPVQHPVEAVFLRRTGAAGRTDDRHTIDMAEHEQMMVALAARDGQALSRIMGEHIRNTWPRIKDVVN